MSQSLGLLEVAGLLSAVTVADTMVKTANVRLLAVEEARGNGWMTVKIEGSVDAVNAAIDAGVVIATKMNVLIAKKVIARPERSVFQLFGREQEEEKTKYEPGIETDALEEDVEENFENVKDVEIRNETALDQVVEEIDFAEDVIPDVAVYSEDAINFEVKEIDSISERLSADQRQVEAGLDQMSSYVDFAEDLIPDVELHGEEEGDELFDVTCNLCRDPSCTRKKGEFKTSCLHYIK